MLLTKYDFKSTKEYFSSTEFLLKNSIIIKTNNISLSLYEEDNKPLTELSIKDPNIKICMYLNNQHIHEITIDRICCYFIRNQFNKQLLFGKMNQKH